jgi:hypothetical protein
VLEQDAKPPEIRLDRRIRNIVKDLKIYGRIVHLEKGSALLVASGMHIIRGI